MKDQKGISLTVLVALIVGLSVVGVAGYLILKGSWFSQSNPGQGGAPLGSAANLVGTWRTPFAVTYYYATDSRTFDPNNLEDVASEDRIVTWTITQGADANTVNIVQSYTSSNSQTLIAGGLWTPEIPQDLNLTGHISSSSLTVKLGNANVGYFTFTSSNIAGTWSDDSYSGLYTENIHTLVNTLILTKQ
ncbi:MAG: hypothetical protein AB1476_01085 [Candidatus Hadarchaeota archaeon]